MKECLTDGIEFGIEAATERASQKQNWRYPILRGVCSRLDASDLMPLFS